MADETDLQSEIDELKKEIKSLKAAIKRAEAKSDHYAGQTDGWFRYLFDYLKIPLPKK